MAVLDNETAPRFLGLSRKFAWARLDKAGDVYGGIHELTEFTALLNFINSGGGVISLKNPGQ